MSSSKGKEKVEDPSSSDDDETTIGFDYMAMRSPLVRPPRRRPPLSGFPSTIRSPQSPPGFPSTRRSPQSDIRDGCGLITTHPHQFYVGRVSSFRRPLHAPQPYSRSMWHPSFRPSPYAPQPSGHQPFDHYMLLGHYMLLVSGHQQVVLDSWGITIPHPHQPFLRPSLHASQLFPPSFRPLPSAQPSGHQQVPTSLDTRDSWGITTTHLHQPSAERTPSFRPPHDPLRSSAWWVRLFDQLLHAYRLFGDFVLLPSFCRSPSAPQPSGHGGGGGDPDPPDDRGGRRGTDPPDHGGGRRGADPPDGGGDNGGADPPGGGDIVPLLHDYRDVISFSYAVASFAATAGAATCTGSRTGWKVDTVGCLCFALLLLAFPMSVYVLLGQRLSRHLRCCYFIFATIGVLVTAVFLLSLLYKE